MDDSIGSAINSLHALFSDKEKDLQERIDGFEKRVALFEKANPESGKSTDVLHLNVGGELTMSVLRSTLTQFEGSTLAAKFSGRWDDSLPKDSEGRFFIDQDPQNFKMLIAFLRAHANKVATGTFGDERMAVPSSTQSFCAMVRYYELMPYVFHMQWSVHYGSVQHEGELKQEKAKIFATESTVFTTESSSGVLFLDRGGYHDCWISKLTVTVPRNAAVCIGWMYRLEQALIGNPSKSCAVQLREGQFRKEGSTTEQFTIDENAGETLVIECTNYGYSYSIRIQRSEGDPISHEFQMPQSGYHPAISFAESSIPITISGLEYSTTRNW